LANEASLARHRFGRRRRSSPRRQPPAESDAQRESGRAYISERRRVDKHRPCVDRSPDEIKGMPPQLMAIKTNPDGRALDKPLRSAHFCA